MDLGLKDRVAIITGGASGIGRCTADHMLAEGVRLLIADRDADALERSVSEMRAQGGQAQAAVVDVSSFDACAGMMETALGHYGVVDMLVNSAGIGGDPQFFAETGPEQWEDLVAINLMGVMNCCRAVTDHMIARGFGKIVSLASEAGKANEKRMVVYGATKGAVISFTRGLAIELGRHSVNVNAVCPGVTHTPMTSYLSDEVVAASERFYPLGRLGRPEDIAPLITFLCSDRASWITGQAISVSGGFGRS